MIKQPFSEDAPTAHRGPTAGPTAGRAVSSRSLGAADLSESVDPALDSIWLGAQHPAPMGQARWLPGHDVDLRVLIEGQGRPLLVVARNSNASGRKGCLAAAVDAHEALIELVRVAGLDVTGCVPPVEELAEWLFGSPNKRKYTERSGRRFLMRSCLVDLSRHGVILSLTAGSSLKLDQDHRQPHVAWVQRVLHDFNEPSFAGMFTKRWDRLSRSTAMGVVHELKALEHEYGSAWSADAELGRMQLGDMSELVATARGLGARAEGLAIRKKAISGVRRLTDERMVDGRASYAHAASAPPGLMRFKDRRTGKGVLALDTPRSYPDRKDTSGGLPDVRDDAGVLVDQVENVRWFLADYGKDGVEDREVVDELVRRRYSTDGLRHRTDHGPTAYWGGPTRPRRGSIPSRWIAPLLDRLDMYETGRLVLPLGTDDGEVIAIEGVMPLDGPWASKEDYRRIRQHLLVKAALDRPPHPSLSWSGFAATLNGDGATLMPSRSLTGGFSWRIARDSSGDCLGRSTFGEEEEAEETEGAVKNQHQQVLDGSASPTNLVPRPHRAIPDRVLTAALVESLVAANGTPMRRFLGDDTVRDRVASLTHERDRVASEVKSAQRQLKVRLDLIMAIDDEGSLRMPKAMHAEAFAEWEHQREAATRKERELVRLDRELATLAGSGSGVSADAMALMVNALRDPAASPYRDELRRGVRDLRFWTEPVKDGSHLGTRMHFAGELVFATGGGLYAVPFSGSHVHGPAGKAEERRLRALARLRAGIVTRGVQKGSTGRFAREAALLLGVDRRRFAVAACGDSALLRLAMAALFPEPAPGEDAALVPRLVDLLADPDLIADFGDLPALVDRIREHYASSTAFGWLTTRQGRQEVEHLLGDVTGMPDAVAREDVWRVDTFRTSRRQAGTEHLWDWGSRGQRPRPVPCRHCGGRLLATVRFPEVTGYLCMAPACRRDARGVRWPARFDQYLCHVDLWLAAGVALTLPTGFTGVARSMRGPVAEPVIEGSPLRSVRQLADADRAAIVDAYVLGAMTTREICVRFAVNDAVLYAVLRAEGIKPSRSRKRTPRSAAR